VHLWLYPRTFTDKENDDGVALRRFCERWKVREMCLFGSALREEAF